MPLRSKDIVTRHSPGFSAVTVPFSTFRMPSSELRMTVPSVPMRLASSSVAVRLSYKCPIIAFWSPYQKNAPFVCLEPWYGVGDPRGFNGEFKEKPFINHLMPGASFMSEYVITIGE